MQYVYNICSTWSIGSIVSNRRNYSCRTDQSVVEVIKSNRVLTSLFVDHCKLSLIKSSLESVRVEGRFLSTNKLSKIRTLARPRSFFSSSTGEPFQRQSRPVSDIGGAFRSWKLRTAHRRSGILVANFSGTFLAEKVAQFFHARCQLTSTM